MTSHDSGRALLRHHGDVDAAPGLVDFAVNVRVPAPPEWLRARLAGVLDGLGGYPSAAADLRAREVVAARHGRRADEVLVLAGAAEGFALLPSLRPRLAAVVHPSFTEPEVALRDAGVPVRRVLLSDEDGYRFRPEAVPEEADLVVLGNPTNPTSVSHPADAVASLSRPGRVLVVDEAFADTIPGEPESLAGWDVPGLLVLRSLTKTWGLAGLRAGYALGAPELLARLALHRPQWPVSSFVLEAVTACCEPAAVAEAAALAVAGQEHTRLAARALGDLVVVPPDAPFALLRLPDGERVRLALRDKGIAVRRGDTFPGLTADHVRVAVRPPEEFGLLVDALRVVLEER
ncbi:Rv2231c family pyridoxal phosphate-dependent protein CobC [Saccharothrix australiensis]|uniref:Aminotransferase n=1 Tax=Saccharothrix australiensis TaxID=2072 RepID=A0A495VU57_9PSEU|nr:Rv2231c family pyridoxal phosphate-dependent protein CobC [Saccharothrix australiensis]RKT52724.1 histidinol-phosphate aminotransferase [Saccharothrix australiensis]